MLRRIAPGVLIAVLLSSCAPQPAQTTADLGEEFTLATGQSTTISGQQLDIKFLEVIGDSRCPTGATCVWQGEVSAQVEITFQGTQFTKVLTQPGLTNEPSAADFNEYEIAFSVLPYPEVEKEIPKSDYRLQLTVDKKPPLSGGVLATFDVLGEKYSVFITNEETIDQVFEVQRGESQAAIPNGRLLRGAVPYNEPWSWHIDPEDVHMAEVTIELCDGIPSHIEANLDYWVDTVQRFCPWQAEIVRIDDYR